MSPCKVNFCIYVSAVRRHFGQRKRVSVRGCEKGVVALCNSLACLSEPYLLYVK